MIFVNSTNDPGQPCVMSSGSAFGCFERRWMKWIVRPSMFVVNCSNRFSDSLLRAPVEPVAPVGDELLQIGDVGPVGPAVAVADASGTRGFLRRALRSASTASGTRMVNGRIAVSAPDRWLRTAHIWKRREDQRGENPQGVSGHGPHLSLTHVPLTCGIRDESMSVFPTESRATSWR